MNQQRFVETRLTAAPGLPNASPGELKFGTSDGFHRALRERVEWYFEATGLKPRDCPQMYLKTALIVVWCSTSYVLLAFVAETPFQALLFVASLGLSMAAVGFNIQHDGGHRAYSERGWVNRLMAFSLDLLGGSSYVWARKHNTIHHSYTNVTGYDDDLNIGIVGRLSPHQRLRGVHRLQHFYLWGLYGFLPLKWQIYDDFRDVLAARSGGHPLSRPKHWELVTFLGGKAAFFTLALVIPLSVHAVRPVLLCYIATTFVEGVVLSVVFQLAHCVEEAEFPLPRNGTSRMEHSWAVHQVETTVDFARNNSLLTWYIGSLNFQIEHHLFPRICHIHYPALAALVEETCGECGVKYSAIPTLTSAMKSHFRWLRYMGKAETPS